MSGPAENQNKNKFCEFHRDKGHNTDECIHLKKQIDEEVKSGQLSHLIKELKQGNNKGEHAKADKKRETFGKEKATAIFMEAMKILPGAHDSGHHRPERSGPEIARRMAKWTFELGAVDINYRPQTSIRGQILVDFIAERPDEDGPPIGLPVEEEIPEP
ncbi:hypothetical protein Tco_0245677 [Tanacetum coccineum]